VADSKEAEYTYDPLGRRIMRKDVDNNTYTYYYYDGLTVLAEKKKVGAGNPTWDKLFTVAPGAIGNILRSNLNYYHYDAMGNLVFISDFDGTPSQSFEQEAYGNVKSGSQSGYHLTTKEYDSSPELYYFWQRWYDPMLGRFISIDPVFNINLYVYCKNDPLGIIDPYGLRSLLYGAGELCTASNCDKCKVNSRSHNKPEDSNNLESPPDPGKCTESDGIYAPRGILKIPDNCTCTIECDSQGSPLGLRCKCRGILARPKVFPTDEPPEGWPPHPGPVIK